MIQIPIVLIYMLILGVASWGILTVVIGLIVFWGEDNAFEKSRGIALEIVAMMFWIFLAFYYEIIKIT